MLRLQQKQTRHLGASEAHRWQIRVQSGEYVEIEVLQQGAELVVKLLDPVGGARREFNSAFGDGTERVRWIAHRPGKWVFEITPLDEFSAGRYAIEWTVQRLATERDQQLEIADSLADLGLQLNRGRKYAEAASIREREVSIRQSVLGTDHPEVASSLNGLAAIYRAQRRYAQADSLYQRAIAIREKAFGFEHPYVALLFIARGSLRVAQSHHREAEPLYQRALAIYERAFGPDHRLLPPVLHNLAQVYAQVGRADEAEPLYRRALAILEKQLGTAHIEVATVSATLGSFYGDRARYREAAPLHRRALEIREKVLGADHQLVAVSLSALAFANWRLGRFDEIEPFYLRSLAIWEKALGAEHANVGQTLHALGMIYKDLARYIEAEALYRRALTILEKARGPEHGDVANLLNSMANLLETRGQYAEAEPLYRRSLAIWEKQLGTEHTSVAMVLNNLGHIYEQQGRYKEAESLHERALSIQEKRLGSDNIRLSATLGYLARVHREDGRWAVAESLFQRSLAIQEKELGADNALVGITLKDLGILYSKQGRHEEAAALHHRSLSITEKALGTAHPSVASRLYGLANAKWSQKKSPSEVTPFLDRAIRVLSNKQVELQGVVALHTLRARVRKEQGALESAIADLNEALQVAEELRPQVGGAEEMRAEFFARYGETFDLMVSWQLESANVERALEYAERGRARVFLDQLASAKVDLLQDLPAEERARLRTREQNARLQLAELQQHITLLRSRADISDAERANRLTVLENSLQQVDREFRQVYEDIKTMSPLWRDVITSGGRPVSLGLMQRRLVPPGGLMLIYQIGAESSHLFLIPPWGEAAVTVPLRIDSVAAGLLKRTPGSLTNDVLASLIGGVDRGREDRAGGGDIIAALSQRKSERGFQKASEALTTAELHGLWKTLIPAQLWPRLRQATEVVIVPDEGLYRLPFEALVVKPQGSTAKSRYWLDEGPPVRYAPSATVLYTIEQRPAMRSVPTTGVSNVLSLSDAIYDPNEVAAARGDQRPATRKPDDNAELTRNRFVQAGGALARLPATAAETEAIRDAFRAFPALGDMLILQRFDATEPKLRAGIEGKRYLHLATHGLVDEQRGALFAAMATTPPADMASPEHDGFLQLHEIYQLRLAEVELAVLSACETNVGIGVDGEGPFALSRGFLSAGARRVVASQWAVEDRSTAALIGQFFRKIVENEQKGRPVEYAQALRDAKRSVRERDEWAHPFYWAPFVLTGSR